MAEREHHAGLVLDGERALYGLRGAVVENCRFEGPADGEFALKECRDLDVRGCSFSLRYPLWHAGGFRVSGCAMEGTCRAPLWYDSDGEISDSEIRGPKCLRECDRVRVSGCTVDSAEFGWKCRDLSLEDTGLVSEYPFLDCARLEAEGLRMRAKYSFQYVSGALIRRSVLETKDAFWHSRDVTVEDSVMSGEYLGWYSENLRLVRCRITGTQPLCYCRGLVLEDCVMEGADLAFEHSDVDATVSGRIDSVKNPRSGRIVADSIGEVVIDDPVMDSGCAIFAGGRRVR